MIRKSICPVSLAIPFLCALLGAQTPPVAPEKEGQAAPRSTTKGGTKSAPQSTPAQPAPKPAAKDGAPAKPALTPDEAAILQWKPGDEPPPLPEAAEADIDNPCELAGFRLQRLFTNYRDALRTGVPNPALRERIGQTLADGTQAAQNMERQFGSPSRTAGTDGFIPSMFARDARTQCDELATAYNGFSPNQPEAYAKWIFDVMPAQKPCSSNLIALSEYCKPPGVDSREYAGRNVNRVQADCEQRFQRQLVMMRAGGATADADGLLLSCMWANLTETPQQLIGIRKHFPQLYDAMHRAGLGIR